jgi:hypothetical protein
MGFDLLMEGICTFGGIDGLLIFELLMKVLKDFLFAGASCYYVVLG